MSEIILVDQKEITLGNVGVPTQVANPRRATIRTAVAAIFGLVLVLNPSLLILIEVLESFEGTIEIPPVLFAVLNGIIVVTAGVISGVTRLLAIPGVNAWITRYTPWLAAIKPLG